MNELEQDPEFVERQRLLRLERDANQRRYQEAATELSADLKDVGFDVVAVSELKEVGDSRAIPVLARWLPQVDYLPLKRDIIATLGSKWGRPDAARPLIDEFYRTPPPSDPSETGLGWSIGDALERVADEQVVGDLMEIPRAATSDHVRSPRRMNHDAIQRWLAKGGSSTFTATFGESVGTVLSRGAVGPIPASQVSVVLRPSSVFSFGFRIHTVFLDP